MKSRFCRTYMIGIRIYKYEFRLVIIIKNKMKRLITLSVIFLTSILFLGFGSKVFAQNKNTSDVRGRIIDSLLTLIKSDNTDTNKIIHANKLCYEYTNAGLYDTALNYGNVALQVAHNLFEQGVEKTSPAFKRIKKGMANSYSNIGNIYKDLGDYPKALDYYSQSLKVAEELGDKKAIAKNLGNSGIVYHSQSDYPKALDYYLRALKITEELVDKKGTTAHLCNIASIYSDQGDYSKALNYSFKALKLAEDIGNKNYIAIILGNIGIEYVGKPDNAKAIEYYFRALKLAKEIGDKNGIAIHLGNIGNIYRGHGDFPKALDYYFKSLKLREELGAKDLIASTLCNIGSLYVTTGKFNSAESYLKRANSIFDSIGALDFLRQTEESLSQLYDTTAQVAVHNGQYLIAAEKFNLSMLYYKKSIALKDTLFSRENKKQLVRKEMNFEFDKKEAVIKASHDKEMAIAEAEKKKQKIVIWSTFGGLLLVVVFAGFIFRSLRITRKQKNIIELQKNEVSRQKEIVEKQKGKIIDSITYAQRIQESILMKESEIQNYLSDCFIYFQPKDIVSGDFYWCTKTGDKIIIAAIDCTGHGVPGAFMSMIGNTLLNQIVNEKHITKPSEILQLLNLGVFEALHQEKDGSLADDGMDIALCCIDYKNNEIQYAGAQNPLYVLSGSQIEVISADIHVIGGCVTTSIITDPMKKEFTNHVIPIKKDMNIYLFSDGYMDQFGGIDNKKFGIKRFKELIVNNQQLGMQKQKELIASAHNEWKGNSNQIDDILIIGIRI